MRSLRPLISASAFIAMTSWLSSPALAASAAAASETVEPISLWWSVPFVLLLASIALMPFINKHWWERWYPAVAAALGAIAAYYYFFMASDPWRWVGEMESYLSFIVLLGSLFIVSGGIVIHVNRMATPMANCVLLGIGAVIANIFGTTGASMLLIRPYLRMNRGHVRPFHVVFFIFIVSNAGGLLTPIGDPPLFLGYLNGVPFWWVLEHCRWLWLTSVLLLLGVFFVMDRIDHGRSEREPSDPGPAVFIHGIHNLVFILVVVWAVFQPGLFDIIRRMYQEGISGPLAVKLLLSRELLMIAAAVGSLALTPKAIHHRNEFSYAPILEVAILFVGIFSTMTPALQWLNNNAAKLPLKTPGQYYFTAGALSSALDNAPTYMTFLEAELSSLDREHVQAAIAEVRRMGERKSLEIDKSLEEQVQQAIGALVQYHSAEILERSLTLQQVEVAFLVGDPKLNLYLVAISAGAVLFGACTYIGNGPNFMVKSIAESSGVKTPGFIGYIVQYTLPILIPIYILLWLLFLFNWR